VHIYDWTTRAGCFTHDGIRGVFDGWRGRSKASSLSRIRSCATGLVVGSVLHRGGTGLVARDRTAAFRNPEIIAVLEAQRSTTQA
jgi:hypothetical protein